MVETVEMKSTFLFFIILFTLITSTLGQVFCSEKLVTDHFCLNDTRDDLKEPHAARIWALPSLQQVYELNDFEETIDFNVHFILLWYHYSIVWEPEYFAGKWDLYRFSMERVWNPRFLVDNLIDFHIVEVTSSSARLDLKYNPKYGSTWYIYKFDAKIKTVCPMDFGDFPFDTQKCMFKLFMLDLLEDELVILPKYLDWELVEERNKNGKWNLQNFEA